MPKKGYKQTKEHILKAKFNKLGKKRSKKIKKKLSIIQKKLWKDKDYRLKHIKGMQGKKRSEETKAKFKLIFKGRKMPKKATENLIKKFKGKTYEQIYGKEEAKRLKDLRRENKLGKKLSNKTKEKIRKSHKGKWTGKNNPNYKDGRSLLKDLIRSLSEYKDWRKEIFERDNFTCQKCNKKGIYLNAHHIKPFAMILNEFLKEYNQFSPIEDKETLLRLATKYKPFWDIKNGITLCKDCHKDEKKNTINKI